MKFKWMSLISIPAVAAGVIPTMTMTSCGNGKLKVIVDTDIGNDCDDIGALTILGNAYKKGKVDVKAVTVCNKSEITFHATDIMLEQYGIDCPMGWSNDDQEIHAIDYAQAIDDKWEARSEKDPTRIKNAVDVLRQTLANNKGGKIKLITLGMLNNIAHLLQSPGDDISPKTGKQLVEENISEIVLMGGRFNDPTYSEFNIKEALWAAKEVINNETIVPMTFCGWEVGNLIKSGLTFYRAPGSPQCIAYNVYNHGDLRESWDPLTMYCAINGAWEYSKMGKVTVEGTTEKEEGRTIFQEDSKGNCRYILMHPDIPTIQKELESWYTVEWK